MRESEIKDTIKQVMAEPKTPKELLDRTIERGKAIEIGAKAEKRLHEMNNVGPNSETEMLVASCIVGRLMQISDMPKCNTSEMLIKNLMQNEAFKKSVQKSSNELIVGLQNGDIIKQIVNPKKEVKEKDISIDIPTNNLTR